METLKLIFSPTIRTHHVFIFITGIATPSAAACADLQKRLIRDVSETTREQQPVLAD